MTTHNLAALLATPQRLAVVGRISPAPRPAFDRLARLAAAVMHTPVGIVNIVGAAEQCFTGAVGLDAGWRGMPTDQGFCPHVVASGKPLLVPNAAISPFADQPVVTDVGVRAYAGVPLPFDHEVVGTVCVLDTEPHPWGEDDLQALSDVASAAVAELRARLLTAERLRLGEAFVEAPCLVAVTKGPTHRLTYTNHAYRNASHHPHTDPTGPRPAAGRPAPTAGTFRLPGPDAVRLYQAVEAAYHDAQPATLTARLPEPAGRRTRTVSFTIAPRRSPTGDSIDGVVIVGVDTTAQAHASAQVRTLGRLCHRGLAPADGPPGHGDDQDDNRPDELVEGLVEVATARPAPAGPPRRRATDRRPAPTDRTVEDPPTEPLPTHGGFTDVIPLSPGRLALVVGDIAGTSLYSAALAGHLRSAIRALAPTAPDPAHVLTRADQLLTDTPHTPRAALTYAVYDAATHTLRWATAGCPTPLHTTAEGTNQLQAAPGHPLGTASPDPYTTHTTTLPPGTTLTLLTATATTATITACLDEPGPTLAATAAHIHAFHPHATVLLARIPHHPRHHVTTMTLPNSTASAAVARHHTTHTLTTWGMHPDLIDPAELLVAELVANAATHTPHTDQPLHLRLHHGPRSVGIEVIDHHPTPPLPRTPTDYDEHGRGLHLLHRLATRWGHHLHHHPDGTTAKAVWAELTFTTCHTQAAAFTEETTP